MFKTVGKPTHRTSQISDLQIIDISRSPVVVFRRELLAYCMFNFMEVRNVGSLDYNVYLSFRTRLNVNEPLMIVAIHDTNLVARKASVKIKSPKLNGKNAVLKDNVIHSLFNIGARAQALLQDLEEDRGAHVSEICQDLCDSIAESACNNKLFDKRLA